MIGDMIPYCDFIARTSLWMSMCCVMLSWMLASTFFHSLKSSTVCNLSIVSIFLYRMRKMNMIKWL